MSLQRHHPSLMGSKKAPLAFKSTFEWLVSPLEVSQAISGSPQFIHMYSNQSSYVL